MSSVLGICWIMMFIASAVDVEFIWWIAVIMSSLQGVHVFFSFGFNTSAREMWKHRIKALRRN